MRILYFLAHPEAVGGASKQMILQASEMKKRGHNVKLVIQCNDEEMYNSAYDFFCRERELETEAAKFPVSTCIEEIDIIRSINSINVIENIIKSYNPDLIHSLQLNISVELVACMRGLPHFFSVYPISTETFNIEWVDIFASNHICDSNYFCKKWRQGLGITSSCIRTITDKNDCNDKNKYTNERDRYELINVAHLSPHKRQLEIIKFVEMCRNSNIRVHISFLGYDEGEYAVECKKYVSDNSLEDWVSFSGFVINVQDYYENADLMVHASTIESYPGVICEAMANKLPVITTPAGGISEIVMDGVNGFLTVDYSAQSIFEKFLLFIDYIKFDKLEDIVENAYYTYLENHTAEAVGNKLENTYKEYIRKPDSNHFHQNYEEVCADFRRFYEENRFLSYSQYTQNHCWYLYHLKKICRLSGDAYIWGAGNFAAYGIEWCEILELNIRGVLDSVKEGEIRGYDISLPTKERILSVDYVIVAVAKPVYVEQVVKELNLYGLVRNKDFFLINNDPCYCI